MLVKHNIVFKDKLGTMDGFRAKLHIMSDSSPNYLSHVRFGIPSREQLNRNLTAEKAWG